MPRRRPSRLDLFKTHGVTPLASRTSNAGQRRAALPAGTWLPLAGEPL